MTKPSITSDEGSQLSGSVQSEAFSIRRRELGFIVSFWLLFATVTFANRVLDPRRSDLDQSILLGNATISLTQALLWALFTVPLFLLAAYSTAERGRRATQLLFLLLATVVAALIVSSTVDYVRAEMFPFQRRGGSTFGGRGGPSRGGHPWWPVTIGGFQFLNDVVVAMGVLAGGFARAYSMSSRARKEQATILNAQLAQARLDALRRQLDPHFLFNTLHAVSSLVERDPRGVRRMIARLSELLRHNIDDQGASEIPFGQELDLLRKYIEIMQVRFQGRLTVETRVDEELLSALVPNMILQPLVENAIKHGIEEMVGEGRIEIVAARMGEQLSISILDNGVGASRPKDIGRDRHGGGIGLRNTVARLEQLYGAQQSFTLKASQSGGMVASISIPYHLSLQTFPVLSPAAGQMNEDSRDG